MTAPAAADVAHDPVATLHPAYFALVMATGIVSVAAHLQQLPAVGFALFVLNNVFYPVLALLLVARAVRHSRSLAADLVHHGRAVGFFTTVAATGVLGTQWLVIGGQWGVAATLWAFSIVLWAVATYGIFTVLTVRQSKPSLPEGINGGWLVSVVAGQSVAVLGAQLAAGFGTHASEVLLFCLVMWLGSGMLYIWIISLIFYRYTFFTLSPSDLAPPYWVNMGAVAISTLAGTALVAASPRSSLVAELLPFVKGLTLLFWATATWWIPMLVILGFWRHVVRRFPLRYDPLYWGAVFPLGMYTVATFRLASTVSEPVLLAIPRVTVLVALAAWTLAFVGLVRSLAGTLRPGKPAL